MLIVQATIRFAIAILAEAALSYLGLGTQPPQPSWGRMLNEAQTLLFQAPLLAVFPGVAIAARGAGPQPARRRPARPVRSAAGAGAMNMSVSANAPARSQTISASGCNTSRGPAEAVRGVSFTLERGETLGLVGESGCGKSITALALMGLLPDSAEVSGSIRFDGSELVGLPDAN